MKARELQARGAWARGGQLTGGGGQEEDEEEDEKEARRTKDGASALAFSCAKGGDASVSRERRSGRVGNLARI